MRIMQSAVNYIKAPFCVKVSLFITLPVVCSKRCAHITFLCQRTQALLWPAHSSAETKPTAFIKLTQCPPTAPPRPSLASPQPHWESTRDISYSAKSCRVPRDVPIYCLSDVWRHKPQISTTWNCSLHKKTVFFFFRGLEVYFGKTTGVLINNISTAAVYVTQYQFTNVS